MTILSPITVLATSEPATARIVTVTGLRNGTAVYLTVTAADLGLTLGPASQPSNTVTPFGPPFAPGAPRADCPPPAACDGQVSLAFDPPGPRPDGTPGDNGGPITSYAVTAHGYDDTVLATASFPSTSGVFPGLSKGGELHLHRGRGQRGRSGGGRTRLGRAHPPRSRSGRHWGRPSHLMSHALLRPQARRRVVYQARPTVQLA